MTPVYPITAFDGGQQGLLWAWDWCVLTQHPGATDPINNKCVERVSKRTNGNPARLQEQLVDSPEAQCLIQ